jgi:hypothetical protein
VTEKKKHAENYTGKHNIRAKADTRFVLSCTVRLREMKTGISEASKRVSIFSFATQGGK